MNKHVISILVENNSGVLRRISGMLSRRCFNIDSISAGVTENKKYTRITISLVGDDSIVCQVENQLRKLIEVVKVQELHSEKAIYRELALLKVNTSSEKRAEIFGVVDIFRGNILDVSHTSITIEITGDENKIDAFVNLMEPYGILELVRTGLTGIDRGSNTINEILEGEN